MNHNLFYCSIILVLPCFTLETRIKQEIMASLTENKEDSFGILLQEIIVKSVRSYKCLAILSDPLYLPLFQQSWFQVFHDYVSYILVSVNESEDLLAPNNETQESLLLAKNNGCQMYIILISNGFQMGRFLKFGDRYRVLNTRSKYVMLFDNRLFEKPLHYLWKRIINVVFIKKYVSKKTANMQSKTDWFELTTVPFPINFGDVLIPRRLDIWAQLKYRKSVDLFKDKTADFRNETLRIATFAHVPGTVKTNQSVSNKIRANIMLSNATELFSGLEIELLIVVLEKILDTLSKVMNFHCELYEPDRADTELWGRKQYGGVFTGLLGELFTSKADMALGDLYYIPFILDVMDLSIPYNTECLTFLTPESLTDISWKTLVLPFSPIMWACVLICLLISSLGFHLLSKFHVCTSKIKEEQKRVKANATNESNKRRMLNMSLYSQMTKLDFNMKYSILKDQYRRPKGTGDPEGLYQFSEPGNSVLYTYSMLLLVSLPKLPTGWSLRMLTGWYWLYCLLVAVAYRASMTAILSKPTPRVTIDSLQELIESKLTYGGWGEINTEFFKSSSDELIHKMIWNFEIVTSSEEAVDRVIEGNFAFYENIYFLKEAIVKQHQQTSKNLTDKESALNDHQTNNNRNLHIMKDCIINMPVSIGLQKNSPIKPRVDKLIRKVLEAGLVNKWMNDVMRKILTEGTQEKTEGQKALMSLNKMYGALVVLAIGYILGLVALVGELYYYKHIEAMKPGFNRYSKMVHVVKKS